MKSYLEAWSIPFAGNVSERVPSVAQEDVVGSAEMWCFSASGQSLSESCYKAATVGVVRDCTCRDSNDSDSDSGRNSNVTL